MQRSLVFMLGGSAGLLGGLAVGQLGAADLDQADREIARLVVQLEELEQENKVLAAWIADAPALPEGVEIVEPAPLEPDPPPAGDEPPDEVDPIELSEDGVAAVEPDEARPPEPEGAPPEPSAGAAEVPAPPPAASPDLEVPKPDDSPSVEDLLGAMLAAEGEEPLPTQPAPSKPASAKPAPAKPTKPTKATGSGSGPHVWPADAPRNLQPAAVDAAVRAALSGVGELAAVDCSAYPCVVAVQATDPTDPCCASLQTRLRAIDGYLSYAGPAQPLTVNGRATIITTWYAAGSDVDLEALSRRMDALRRAL